MTTQNSDACVACLGWLSGSRRLPPTATPRAPVTHTASPATPEAKDRRTLCGRRDADHGPIQRDVEKVIVSCEAARSAPATTAIMPPTMRGGMAGVELDKSAVHVNPGGPGSPRLNARILECCARHDPSVDVDARDFTARRAGVRLRTTPMPVNAPALLDRYVSGSAKIRASPWRPSIQQG